jgi:hypothetical protein
MDSSGGLGELFTGGGCIHMVWGCFAVKEGFFLAFWFSSSPEVCDWFWGEVSFRP